MIYSHDYTINEITAMAAGAEMDAAIATTFFGWRWMKYQSPNNHQPKLLTGIFPPPAEGRTCVCNNYDSIWSPSDRHAPRFSDWHRATWWEDNFAERKEGVPYYSTDMNDAQLVMSLYQDLAKHTTSDFLVVVWGLTGREWWCEAFLRVTAEIVCRAALLQTCDGLHQENIVSVLPVGGKRPRVPPNVNPEEKNTWKDAADPPKGSKGFWTNDVIAYTNLGNVFIVAYYHGEHGGCWQRPKAFHDGEIVEKWIERPE